MDRLHTKKRESAAAREQTRSARTRGEMRVFLEGAAQPGLLFGVRLGELDEIAVQDVLRFGAQYVSEAAGHARAKIEAEGPENQGDSAGHVFASVLADAFDDRERAAIAHGEAFAGAAGDKKLAGGGPVENGITGKDIAAARSGGAGGDGNRAAGQSLADVIVGFAI